MSNKKLLSHQDNIKIYEDTRKIALASNFPIEPTLKYNLDSTILNIDVNKSGKSLKQEVLVIANDSFSAAHILQLELEKANHQASPSGNSFGSISETSRDSTVSREYSLGTSLDYVLSRFLTGEYLQTSHIILNY